MNSGVLKRVLLLGAVCSVIMSFDIFRGRRDTMYGAALRAYAPAIVLPPGIFVSTLGSDANAGTNHLSAVKSLPAAIQRMSLYGRTNVYVAKGLYTRGNGLAAGMDGVTISGAGMNFIGGWENSFFSRSASERSILDGGNAVFRVVLISNAQTIRFDGFSIVRGGTTTISGGGIALIGVTSAILSNNLIMSNAGYNGGGLHASNCTGITIASSCFFSNRAQNYGGAFMSVGSQSISIHDSLMLNGNGAAHAGGFYLLQSANIIVSNVSILSNAGGSGAASSIDSSTNVTFVRVTAASNALAGQTIYLNSFNTFTLRDSYITNNDNTSCSVLISTSPGLTISHCVFGGVAGTLYGIMELSDATGHTLVNNGFISGTMNNLYHDLTTPDANFTVDVTGIGNLNTPAQTGAAVSSGNILY